MKVFLISLFLRIFCFRKNKKYLVCFDHIGETVYALLYYRKIKENYPNKKIILVCKKYTSDIGTLFNVDSIIYNKLFLQMLGCYCQRLKVHETDYVFYAGYVPGNKWYSWNSKDVFKDFSHKVMGFNTDELSYPQYVCSEQFNVIQKYNIKNNSVLISPYAKSCNVTDMKFWESLVQILEKKGYEVFTNIAGVEKPIKNTKPFNVSLLELYSSASEFAYFIGLRSGVCDCVALTDSNMIIITDFYWRNWIFDSFSKAKNTFFIWENYKDNNLIEKIDECIDKI